MHASQSNGSFGRPALFSRHPKSPSPSPRPKSIAFPTSSNGADKISHGRNSSLSHSPIEYWNSNGRPRSGSSRQISEATGTFAPQFIKSEELRRGADQIQSMEGDNDFSGKRYVWLKDPEKAFVRGQVIEECEGGVLLVQCEDGSVRTCP